MAEFLIDTNVLSRIFTGDKNVKDFIETLDAAICTSSTSNAYKAQNQFAKNESSKVISVDLSLTT